MGWIGDASRIEDALKARGAGKDEQGRFLIRSGRVVTFMGAGGEAVVDDACECLINGEWTPLIPLLHGGLRVTVI